MHNETKNIFNNTFEQSKFFYLFNFYNIKVFLCSICGNYVQCNHDSKLNNFNEDNNNNKIEKNNLDSEKKSLIKEKYFQEGTLGNTPNNFYEKEGNNLHWFGPLVLASLAVIGIAMGIFKGDIIIPQLQNISSRVITAITIILEASNSIFKFLR